MEKINFLVKFWDRPINGCQVYFTAFLFYFLPMFLIETTFSPVNRWLRLFAYISLPLLFFKIYVLDHWKKKELFAISLLLVIELIVWRMTHYPDLLLIGPFIIGAKGVNFRDIISWYFYLTLILVMTMMILSLTRIIPNLVYYSASRPTRYALGMLYPSVIAAHYFYLALAYCYLRFGKLNVIDYLLIISGDVICILLTNTKLDFLATLLIIPVMIIAQRAYFGKKWSSIIAAFWWMAIPISASIMIFLSYFYNPSNHLLRKIDSLLSGRLGLGRLAFKKYDLNLLGRTIIEHSFAGIKGQRLNNSGGGLPQNYFYIDSSYMRMLLLWGLLAFIIVIVCLTFIALRSTVRKTFILSAVILVASLSFMFEPHIIQIIYNPFLLALLSNSQFNSLEKENKKCKILR
ncbi:polymerase [Limosilactobacillus vaginalis]|uniref:polymerase n=1 Tax=Limosilactobacillus vaginalis TaxID=1633 RepID=UPI0025A3DA5A|nr:polymerase [Limosilactobacillus vaginalis]MDM8243792.1 polymerase [Limosilactobacillus vaginalis]